MAKNYDKMATSLAELQSQELSIIRLSEPISASNAPHERTSDVSASDAFDNPSPASLAADLSHYKACVDNAALYPPLSDVLAQELFSKLRFSYLEQVTKEKFLRAITGDPPHVVEHQENIELEAQLVGVKAELKAQKLAVAAMVEELEARARQLSTRKPPPPHHHRPSHPAYLT